MTTSGRADGARRRCLGSGLMFAGLVVMLIGLAVVLMRSLALPAQWTPVVVGAVRFLVGAARRVFAGGDSPGA